MEERPLRLVRGLTSVLLDSLAASSWPLLVLRLWRGYVLASGAIEAAKVGAAFGSPACPEGVRGGISQSRRFGGGF